VYLSGLSVFVVSLHLIVCPKSAILKILHSSFFTKKKLPLPKTLRNFDFIMYHINYLVMNLRIEGNISEINGTIIISNPLMIVDLLKNLIFLLNSLSILAILAYSA
jgi:hypothetical protein